MRCNVAFLRGAHAGGLVLLAAASSPIAAQSLSGPLTLDQRQTLLDRHNQLRDDTASGVVTPAHPAASDMNYLFWDDALAQVAQDWADGCQFQYNPDRADDVDPGQSRFVYEPARGVGENLGASFEQQPSMGTLLNSLQDWWVEHEFYDYATRSCSGVCGHYTQMVWANTRYVSCGSRTARP